MISCVYISVGLINLVTNTLPQVTDSSDEECDYVLKGYDLGASCDFDEDCLADHSYCHYQQECQCRPGYRPAPDGITCLADIGARCLTKYDCITLLHSDCRQDVCKCESNFVPDSSGRKCLPRVTDIGGLCELDMQCQASFGDYSHCWGMRCECQARYHFLNGRCCITKDLNEFCNHNDECYIGSAYTNVVMCKDQRCQCLPGYYIDDYRKCRWAAGSTITPLFFSLILPLTILVLTLTQ